MNFDKQVKQRKVLHKVKKNWVVIGMMSVTLLGSGYVVSQLNDNSAGVVAHADGTSTESSANYPADSSNVSASVQTLSTKTTGLKAGQVANYSVTLNNNDDLGRVIPQGTQIQLKFNTPQQANLSAVLDYSTYSRFNAENVFSVSQSGNTITLTANKDLYPGSNTINLSLIAKDPGYNWDGESSEHETNPDDVNVSIDASLIYQNQTISAAFSGSNALSVSPNTKSEDDATNQTPTNSVPGHMGSSLIHNFPGQGSDSPYPSAKTNQNDISNNGTSSVYAPVNTNPDGKPYLATVAEYNAFNDLRYSGAVLSISNAGQYDLKNVYVYAGDSVDNLKDVTNESGIKVGIDGNNALYVDFSKSAYTHSFVDLVAYIPYTDLTAQYSVQGYLNYYDNGNYLSQTIGAANYTITPTGDNTQKTWLIAPTKTYYTDVNGKVTVSVDQLLSGVSGYKRNDSDSSKFDVINPSDIKLSNAQGLDSGVTQTSNFNNPKEYDVEYQLNGETKTGKVYVINPYEQLSKTVQRTVTVKYVDQHTGTEIAGENTHTATFEGNGIKDDRYGSIQWNPFTPQNDSARYTITSPSVTGYHLVNGSDSEIDGSLQALGSNVLKTVYYAADVQQSSSASENSSASSSTSAQSSSASQSSSTSAQSSSASQSSSTSAQSSSATQSSSSSSQSSSAAQSSSSSSQASSSASTPTVDEHGNNNGKSDKKENTSTLVNEHKNNDGHHVNNTSAKSLPQTGDQTNQKSFAITGLVIGLIGLGMAAFGIRRKNK